MNKILYLVPIVFLIIGCAEETQSIKIGANLALSGKLAFYGTATKNGIELAVLDVNNAGGIAGKKLVLVSEDNQGDAKTATVAMQKMLSVDKIDVAYSILTPITQAVVPLTQAENKLLMYHSAVSDMARKNSLAFRDYFDFADQGAGLGVFVAPLHQKVAYFGEQSDVCEQFYVAFANKMPQNSIVSKQTFDASETDFRTALLKAKATGAQVLVLCTWRSEDLVMKQLDQLGMLDTQTYHAVAQFLPSSHTVDDLFKKNHAVSTWYGFGMNTSDPKVQTFTARYHQAYGVDPIPDALYSYDDVMFLSVAMKACKSAEAGCVANYLSTHDYNGVAGILHFGSERVETRPSVLLQYGENGWEAVSSS